MKKSYISLILSSVLAQALVSAEAETNNTVTANFGDKNNGGKLGNYSEANKGNGLSGGGLSLANNGNATYGNDWTGSDTYLDAKTNITFKFTDGKNGNNQLGLATTQPENLFFKDNFKFTNGSGNGNTTITITVQGANSNRNTNTLKNAIFGKGEMNQKIVLGSNLTLKMESFTKIEVRGHFFIDTKSIFDASSVVTFNNFGAITLEKESKLKIQNTLTNSGTIIFGEGSSLESAKSLTIDNATNKRGKLDVQGNATITSGTNGMTIEGQDIVIKEGKSLTLSKGTGTGTGLTLGADLTLGLGDSAKQTTISGGEVKIDGFGTLNTKDLKLTNTTLSSSSLQNIKNKNLSMNNSHIKITSTNGASILGVEPDSGTSTFTLTGRNSISTTGSLTIKGNHTFGGGGTLDFVGDMITLGEGNGTSISFDAKAGQGGATLGFSANTLTSEKLKATGLTLQIINNTISTLKNKSLELDNVTLAGVDSKGEEQVLVIENGNTSGSPQAEIKIIKGTTSTLQGKEVQVYGQKITIGSSGSSPSSISTQEQGATLILKGSESITLGKADAPKEPKQEGKVVAIGGEGGANNTLDLQSTRVKIGGEVEFDKLQVRAGGLDIDKGVTFELEADSKLTLKSGVSISTERENGYSEMSFVGTKASDPKKGGELQIGEATPAAGMMIVGDTTSSQVTLKASSFSFQDINVSLGNNTTGASLNLDASNLPSTNPLAPNTRTEQLEVGSFSFTNTTFTNGSSSKLNLYAGDGGASVLASGLTLDNVSLFSYKINGNGEPKTNQKNALIFSNAANSDLIILGTSTIEGSAIYHTEKQDKQGIGTNLTIGNETKKGSLTIKSELSGESFTIGGNLTIDKRGNSGESNFDIELGSNGGGARNNLKKLSTQTLALEITGGITAIHKESNGSAGLLANGNETEIKAKKFTFGENSTLESRYGTLKLNTKEDMQIEVKGAVKLIGNDSKIAQLQVVKNGNTVTSASVGTNDVKLKLHNIEAQGKAKIEHKDLTFMDSFIKVSKNGTNNGDLTLKDTNSATGKEGMAEQSQNNMLLQGTIAGITLSDGNLTFQTNGATGSSSSSLASMTGTQESLASIKLKKEGSITSSGTSSLKLKSIYVNDEKSTTDLYTLKVIDGTFTLLESDTKERLGAIVLGDEEKKTGGNFIFGKTANGTMGVDSRSSTTPKDYNKLKIQDNIFSYYASSITAESFESTQKSSADEGGSKNYKIGNSGGELKFNVQSANATTTTLKADFVLENGSFGLYDKNSQLGKLSLQDSSISASGDSMLQASALYLGGAKISAKGGTLTLKGIESSTQVGDINVGDHGRVTFQNQSGGNSGISLKEGSTITLGANVPYVQVKDPLGGGAFGQVKASSISFEKAGDKSLINIIVSADNPLKVKDDSLFALREGKVKLITTDNGITKKSGLINSENITLKDISVDKGGYSSLVLTPEILYGDKGVSKDVVLGITVKKTTLPELIESIQDSQKKDLMGKIAGSGINGLILESIINSNDNPFKVGMTKYIEDGNTDIVLESLSYMTGAFLGAAQGLYASDKVAQEQKMLQASNLENRMLRLTNPHTNKLQLASLIQKLSKNRYASNDDEILLDEEDSGVDYGTLWATYDGAISFGEFDGASVNGITAGYDTFLGERKEYLLGFYANYGYGSYNADFVNNSSHNFGLGVYTRMSFDEHNEVDLVASQTVGLNHTRLNLGAKESLVVKYLNQTLKYNFYTTDFQARYGYTFKVGEEESPYYFRPFGGVNFGVVINSDTQGDGVAPIGFKAVTNYKLGINFGVEMRKYFDEFSYIYMMPVLEKGLLNDSNLINVGFVGAENLTLLPGYMVDTGLGIYAGGQGNVGENISVTGGVGFKYGVETKEMITNWNVGLKYKF